MDNILLGKFFHIFKDGKPNWQGQVTGQIDETHYLCQLYDFIMGDPSTIHIFTIDQMTSSVDVMRGDLAFQFYMNDEHWRQWYEDRFGRK